MKPFNLEQALAGAPVVYRNGERVSEVKHLATLRNQSQSVIAVPAMQGGHTITRHDTHGAYMPEQMDCAYDLFMAPVKREGWLVKHKDNSQFLVSVCIFSTEEVARESVEGEQYEYIRVEWEE